MPLETTITVLSIATKFAVDLAALIEEGKYVSTTARNMSDLQAREIAKITSFQDAEDAWNGCDLLLSYDGGTDYYDLVMSLAQTLFNLREELKSKTDWRGYIS